MLDSAEADNLLRVLTLHLPTLNPKQLAAVLSSTLPCLGAAVPTDDSSLALLFAAAGAAARAGMGAHEAGHLLVVLAGLSRYAPDAEVTLCGLQNTYKHSFGLTQHSQSSTGSLESSWTNLECLLLKNADDRDCATDQ